MKINRILIRNFLILLTLLTLVPLGYWFFISNQVNESKEKNNVKESENLPENPISVETGTETFKLENINIKDGDVFSVPEKISFSIVPKVDITLVALENSSGKLLYDNSFQGSDVATEIYPQSKVSEGETGFLTIKGIKDNQVVIINKIEVSF